MAEVEETLSGEITPHFTWGEAKCHCGKCPGWGNAETQRQIRATAAWAEKVRIALGNVPMRVNSWYRCPVYNRQIGGASDSQHLQGKAIDFGCKTLSPRTVQQILRKRRDLVIGLGSYSGFTHADRRDGPPATWRG
jgi:peptidase M15-like protein